VRRTGLYWPELDGMRALAVFAVLAVHADLPFALGGHIGVDVFFVLSGFLITFLMLEETSSTGTVGLRAFYARRALRLLPALFALLAVLSILVLVGWDRVPEETARGIPAAAFYYGNWLRAFEHTLGWLDHTWSLSIEEQFYMLWPAAFLVVGLAKRNRNIVAIGLLSLALAVGLYRWGFWSHDAYRAINSFDTRADTLLIGCAIAFGLPAIGLSTRVLKVAGLVALLGLAVWFVALPSRSYAYLGPGATVVPLLAATVLVAILKGALPVLQRWLAWGPLVYLGRISYGIYIWHYPVFRLWRLGLHGIDIPLQLVRVAVAVLLAVASYHLLEARFLRLRGRMRRIRAGQPVADASTVTEHEGAGPAT
jgi:peptidoglycan/LPS O-acetylase OafA/YrhL